MSNFKKAFFGKLPLSSMGLTLIIAFGVIQPLIFLALYARLGNFIAIFSLIPTVLVGWHYGLRPALISGIAAMISSAILLATLAGSQGLDAQWVIGSLFVIITGFVVGWAGERIRSLRLEIERREMAEMRARDMTTAAQALRVGISAVNSNLSLEEILDQILIHLSQVIAYDAANVMLIEEGIGRIIRHRGYNEEAIPQLNRYRLPVVRTGSLQVLWNSGKPAVIPHTKDDKSWRLVRAFPWIKSYVGAPIAAHNQVIGFLNLNSATPGFFTPRHAERLQDFADQVATAIYNARLLTEARQQTERLTMLLETTQVASATLDLDKMLPLVAERLVKTLNVTGCVLSRWDRESDALVVWIDYDLHDEGEEIELPGTVYPLIDYPVARKVLTSGEPITVLASDPNIDPAELALLKKYNLCSDHIFPLETANRVIGIVELFDRDQERYLTESEIALCRTLLDQVAVFVVNANLFNETKHQTLQLAVLNELASEINTVIDVTEICQLVASRLYEVFGFYNVCILKADHASQELVALANAGAYDHLVEVPKYRQPFSRGIMGMAVLAGEPIIVNDTRQRPEFFELEDMVIRSEAALPFFANHKLGGVLNVDSKELNSFGEREVSLLTTVASQLSTALEKAWLFGETRRRAQQLEALRQAGLSVTASLELPQVLKEISKAALDMVALEGVHIFIYDQGEVTFGSVLWADGRPDTPFSTPRPGGFTHTVAKEGQLIIAPDIQKHRLFATAPPEWQGALVGLPLKIRQRVVGVMTVSRAEPSAFSGPDLQTLYLLADQAAIAIENARLYRQTQEEIEERKRIEVSLRQRNLTLELLTEFSRELAVPLRVNPILSNIVRITGEALDLTSMYICDWNETTGSSTVLAEYISDQAAPAEKESDLGRVYNMERDFGDNGNWLRHAIAYEVLHVDDPDLPSPEREHMRHYGVQSTITVPLLVGDHTIGYLEGWESRRKRNFAKYEVELFQAISRQVASGVHNAMLYESVRQSEEQFRLIFELAPTGMAIMSLDGRFIRVNQAFCNMTGYMPQELVKMNVKDITHPDDLDTNLELDRQLLHGEIPHFSMEKRYVHKVGPLTHVIFQVALVKNNEGEPLHFIGQAIDITQRKLAEERLRYNIFHDALTNLPNRSLFLNHVQRAIGRAERQNRYAFAVLFLDLDRFKVINDSLGHSAGDEVLKIIASRLLDCVRPGDLVARLGGDEFAVLLDDIAHVGEAQRMVDKIQHSLGEPIFLSKHELSLTGSIGIAVNSSARHNPEDYIRDVDIAMYKAKAKGGGRFEIFDDKMHVLALDRLRLETDLRQAVQQEELEIYYQPVLSVETGRLVKVEALLRWPHAKHGFIPPDQFVPLAEETGLIHPISRWLLNTTCKQAKMWHDMGHPIRLAVNVSVHQFQYQDLPTVIEDTLARTGFPAAALELEITESIAILSETFSVAPLQRLSELGVTISIDDFGTGYSSLSRLKSLPIHTLKIDRSFIMNMMTNMNNEAIVTAIITMAHGLQLNVVAEGVETAEQFAFLRDQNCNEVQGFLFSPPITAETILGLLSEQDLRWQLSPSYVI